MKQRRDRPTSVLDLNVEEARKLFADMGEPPYRASQLFSWVFGKHVVEWGAMSNFPLKLREQLAREWAILTSRVERVQESRDRTAKLLVRLCDGEGVETVCIPEKTWSTICLSTQVGCPIGCAFCASGKGGLKRNLRSGEILEQILQTVSMVPPGKTVRNVVFMGMGEPLRNYDAVLRAVRAINAPWGFGIGARRITISTIGDIKGIERLSKEPLQVNLAISLHGPDDQTRGKIVPSPKVASVALVVKAARNYFAETGRKVTFEYVLIGGVNDSVQQAKKLALLVRGFPCFVNLIPLNSVDSVSLRSPDRRSTLRFLHELERIGVPAAIRQSRGNDISAACGQLAGRRNERSTKAPRPHQQP